MLDQSRSVSVSIKERLVVAPRDGRFRPLPPENFACEGEWVERGQVVGLVTGQGGEVEVVSPFQGWVMGALVLPGQPVKEGQALLWIWSE